jgi:cytochrome P450
MTDQAIQTTLLGAMGAAMTAAAQHSSNAAQGAVQGSLAPGQIWSVPGYPMGAGVVGYSNPLQQQQVVPSPFPPVNWSGLLNTDVFLGDGPLVDSSDPQLSARIRVAERVLQRSNGRRYRDIARDIVALLDAMHLQEAFDLEGTIE